MKRIVFIIFINLNIICISAQLPLLNITTINGETPTCDFIFPPEGATGVSTTNQNVVPGRAILSLNDSIIFDSGEYEEDFSGITIRIRGNSSAYLFSKKPYKIKLEKKYDMLGRGDKRFYDKNWILVNAFDTNINTVLGLKINELLGLGDWTPQYVFVEFYLNNKFMGIYMLMENIRRNADCRINVDKNTGYLIECDPYWWNEPIYFTTSLNKNFTFKYPNDDTITEEQIEYIKLWIDQFEESISTGNYDNYIDVESFALWLLAHDILSTWDCSGSNQFITKYDNTIDSKLKMSTLWDFDTSFNDENNWGRVHEHSFFYYPLLFNSPNNVFTKTYKNLWNKNKDKWFDEMNNFLQEFRLSETARNLQAGRMKEAELFGYSPADVYTNIDDAIQWFNKRKQWLDTHINDIPTEIYHVYDNSHYNKSYLMNINGQRVSHQNQQTGIYIKNGKKIIRK